MQSQIEKRIFIIGTARSGTTFLQSLVGAHSRIFTLPETHFFDQTLHPRKSIRFFEIITRKKKKILEERLSEINLTKEYLKGFSTPSISKKKWGKFLLDIIDSEAIKKNKFLWVEKTPRNIRYIDFINSLAENIYFIHIHRDPEDNIASLYEVGKKYPDSFKQNNLDACIDRYITEFYISLNYLDKENHYHIIYEDLVLSLENSVKGICDFLNIEFEDSMLNFQEKTKEIVVGKEQWKANNFAKIKNEKKSVKLFNPDELKYLRDKVAGIDLNIFRKSR